jgi:gluconolactonase
MTGRSMLAGLLLLAASGARGADVEVINAKSYFPEGPLWHDGQLYYVEYSAHRLMTWDDKENRRIWQQEGCGPSAVIAGGDGNFLITCYDADNLVRVTPAGVTVETFAQDADGLPFLGPNDAVADARGGVYFSASGKWDITAPIEGKILYLAADGAISAVANDIHYANGLALSPDGTTLYVSEMAAQRVLKFEVGDDGALGRRYLFARLADLATDPEGVDVYAGPDGLKTDSAGNLYIAHFEGGRILVADPDGSLLDIIDVPARYVTNLTFGASEDVLFVTAATDAWTEPYPGQVYRIETR